MAFNMIENDIANHELSKVGIERINWAATDMPVLNSIKKRFDKEKPLKGITIAACLHVTTETANLMITLKSGGANVLLCASNPLSTQDDVAAALVKEYGISTFAIKGEDNDTYYKHIKSTLSSKPNITMDDGADLVSVIHNNPKEYSTSIIGGTEETTTGVIRLKALSGENKLIYPIIAVNEADTKHLFDNRYGTGQSTLDGITRATNILWSGRKVVIAGYGWCGRGIASRARGLGSNVIVTEVNPTRALEAIMDGFSVMPMEEASTIGDIFITATGGIKAIDTNHMINMKDGAIIANSGHFNVEINIPGLQDISSSSKVTRQYIEEYTVHDKKINLLAEGRLVNLAAAEGHPSSVMDMSFANQALCVEHIIKFSETLSASVHDVPKEIDEEIGRLKLSTMGVSIDNLTQEQIKYLHSWTTGT